MQEDTVQSLELDVASQCAPVLAGIKASNLLILDHPKTDPQRVFPKESGILAQLLYESRARSIWLVYRPDALERVLSDPQNRVFLKEWGYESAPTECMVERLAERYRGYRESGEAFPHEMGVFLGYPLCDVKGFIAYGGQNYLYSGYWKVYGNVEETKRQFQLFAAVKKSLIEAVRNGMGLRAAGYGRLAQPV